MLPNGQMPVCHHSHLTIGTSRRLRLRITDGKENLPLPRTRLGDESIASRKAMEGLSVSNDQPPEEEKHNISGSRGRMGIERKQRWLRHAWPPALPSHPPPLAFDHWSQLPCARASVPMCRCACVSVSLPTNWTSSQSHGVVQRTVNLAFQRLRSAFSSCMVVHLPNGPRESGVTLKQDHAGTLHTACNVQSLGRPGQQENPTSSEGGAAASFVTHRQVSFRLCLRSSSRAHAVVTSWFSSAGRDPVRVRTPPMESCRLF